MIGVESSLRNGALSMGIAAGLDELGIAVGERIAMVSHNSARLLALFGCQVQAEFLSCQLPACC